MSKNEIRKIPYGVMNAVVLLIAILILYWRYLTGQYVYIFPNMINDGITQFYPWYLEAARNYARNGMLEFYTFFDGFGNSAYYGNPFQIMIFMFGEDMVPYMMGLKVVLCIFLSGWFMGMFLHKAGFSNTTCILGSFSLAFSIQVTGMGGWMSQGEMAVVAALTLLLLEKIFRREKWYQWSVLLVIDIWLVTACVGLYFRLLYGAITFVYLIIRILYLNSGWNRISFRKKILLCSMVGVLVIIGVSILTPQMHSIFSSSRFQGGMADWKHQWAVTFSGENMKNIFTAFFRTLDPNSMGIAGVEPYQGTPFGWYSEDGGFYVGLLTLTMLPFWGGTRNDRKKKVVLVFFLVCAGAFICLPGVRLLVNGFANTTFKLSRLWICLTLIVCGCFGWEYCVERTQEIRCKWLIFPGFVVILLLFLSNIAARGYIRRPESVKIILILLIFEITLYYCFTQRKSLNGCKYFLLFLGCLEMIATNYRFVNNSDALSMEELTSGYYCDETGEVLQLLPERLTEQGVLNYRVNKSYESVMCLDPMAQEYNGTTFYRGGVDDIWSTKLLKFAGIPSKLNKVGYCTGTYGYPVLSAIFGVQYGISNDSIYMEQGYQFCQNVGSKTLYTNNNMLPIAFGYYQAIEEDELRQYTVRERQEIFLQACVLQKEDMDFMDGLGTGFEKNTADVLREMIYEDYKIGTPIEFDTITDEELAVINIENRQDVCLNMYWSTTEGRWSDKDFRTISVYEENGNSFIEIDNQTELNGIIFYLYDDDVATSIDKITVQVYDREEYEHFLKDKTELLRKTCKEEQIRMERNGIIFISIPYNAPFDYYLNGHQCTPVRANFVFTGLPVEAGTYHLEIKPQ